MTKFIMRLDMRTPEFARAGDDYYQTAIDMVAWADRHGFAECMLSEHHACDDDYLPSPLILAAAIAARTQQIRTRISALVLPLHDPLRIAEDIAVIDRIGGGRIELVIVSGFRPLEFAMFDKAYDKRGRLVEEGVEVLKKAWTGEAFEYRGATVQVTPRPIQQPGPPILLGGSSVIAAKRAARIADGFIPAVPELYADYLVECEKLGVTPGAVRNIGPGSVFVTHDPEAFWAKLAPHALHETNGYAKWYAETDTTGPYQPIEDASVLRDSGLYHVVTPAECIELCQALGEDGWMFVHPLLAGLDPELAWQSLKLLADEVMPALA